MSDYRLCCVDSQGGLSTEEIIQASTDEEAIKLALDLNRAPQCELWQDARLVASLGANRRTGAMRLVEDF